MRDAVRGWWSRFRDDLNASTDASLLGPLRFLGLLQGPIDTSLPIDQAFKKALRNRVSRHAGWQQAIGGITYLLFVILVATGVLLSFYYRPSAEEAYQSLQHIVSGARLGWLMRDVHVWGANLVVLGALLHMARVFFGSAYKSPRETNWLIGVLLLFTIFAFGATGYLLPWDQGAWWTVSNGLGTVSRIPLIGGATTELLRGDPIVSGATLSRFFALHVIVLPWIALGLLVLHFTLARKHGVAPPPAAISEPTGAIEEGPPFFPHVALRSLITGVLVVAIVITAAILFPRETTAPANPADPPALLRSTWIVADVSRALIHYLGFWGLSLFMLLGTALILLPIFDRSPERTLRRRPAVAALGILFFLTFAIAWVVGFRLRTTPFSGSDVRTSLGAPAKTAPRGAQPTLAPSAAPIPRPDSLNRRRQP
jgi:quinol-cytochrome oxidoreductase complex cytochrome b subunit